MRAIIIKEVMPNRFLVYTGNYGGYPVFSNMLSAAQVLHCKPSIDVILAQIAEKYPTQKVTVFELSK
jgi:chemotaxis response regulator CheB